MADRLRGKSAVITGAAKGIGRATAVAFAAEGARIVATDVDAEGLETLRAELTAPGAEVATVVGDVSDPDDAQRMATQLREGIVQRKPAVELSGEIECDEVSVDAGHKGNPEAVRKKGERAASDV